MTSSNPNTRRPHVDLRLLMKPVADALLGDINEEQSNRYELRYRRRGSLKVDLESGTWIDFELNEGGGVLDLIERELGLQGKDAFDWMRSERIVDHEPPRSNPDRTVIQGGRPERTGYALQIWRQCQPADGTLVETYLRHRGITEPVPPTLRYHPALQHRRTGTTWPAMVAAVTCGASRNPQAIIAIHRTYIARDGLGKAPVTPAKMELGPCHGGAVRLAPLTVTKGEQAAAPLGICEGIETGLSVMTARPSLPVWAALSTSGLKTAELPPEVRTIIVLADADAPGEAAAVAAAQRWQEEGRRVKIARPPQGQDFNDVLLSREGR